MQTITLTITNVDRLPDGGPVTYTAAGQRFEIGRDPYRDWSLPDPQLYISGRHCEIAPGRDGYVLNDISRNGTFVNGSQQRVKSPYLLCDGDLLAIGNYIVLVRLSQAAGEAAGFAAASPQHDPVPRAAPAFPSAPVPAQSSAADPWMTGGGGDDDDIWGAGPVSAPPMDRRDFQPAAAPRHQADFVESHLDMPVARRNSGPVPPESAPNAAGEGLGGWSASTPPMPEPAGFPPPPSAASSAAAPARPAEGFPAEPAPRRPAPPAGAGDGRLLAAFCEGANLAPHVLARRDQAELFREIGAMMLTVSDEVSQLLRARASARAMVKTADRTMIGAQDNNPLKFLPGSAEALEAMLARDRMGYLDGPRAFRQAFDDLKKHEMATYAAMQRALARLLDDLSPDAVEAKVTQSPFSNRKAKAWETFVARWEAKTESNANGMLDVFLAYFSEAYQQMSAKER